MSLYGNPANFRTQKVLIAAKLAGKQIKLVPGSAPTEQFPLEAAPAFEDSDVHIFQADAIAAHLLAQKPISNEQWQWVLWAEGQLLPTVLAYVLPSISAAKVCQGLVDSAKKELLAQLVVLNKALVKKTFLAGERFSYADVSVALDLLPAYQYVLGDSARAGIKNVTRWFLTVVNQPAVKEVIGAVSLINEPSTFDEKAYEEVVAKLKTLEPKQQQKPKAAAPAKKAKEADAEEEMDAADEAAAAQPKFTDPLAMLPAGTFNMDQFKRVYSNEDTATKAIPHFWENFDPAHNSIWYCEYKYPQELRAIFMSCNLITGMFQRLEKLKKHAFASVILFGEDNKSSISGVWVWKGQDLAFEQCPDWQVDYESYEWKKLDPASEETKKLVNEYWLWEGDFGGKKFNQGKIFK
jgi:elongation factor 1-gamma